MKTFSLAIIITGSLALDANAASFAVSCEGQLALVQRGCTVKLSGQIVSGDADRLRKIIRDPLYGEWHYNTLLLDSPGGSVSEAIAIAGVVREAMLRTTTTRLPEVKFKGPPQRANFPCVSACFLVWVAGTERSSMSGQNKHDGVFGIGLHRPYFTTDTYNQAPAKIAEAQQAMTASVRDYLRREMVPEQFIEQMLNRSSREVYWLHESGDEFALNGRAAWFEEMMIARCKFDPKYDRDAEAEAVRRLMQKKRAYDGASQTEYIKWRQNYNACEYRTRLDAQAHMRK